MNVSVIRYLVQSNAINNAYDSAFKMFRLHGSLVAMYTFNGPLRTLDPVMFLFPSVVGV